MALFLSVYCPCKKSRLDIQQETAEDVCTGKGWICESKAVRRWLSAAGAEKKLGETNFSRTFILNFQALEL